MKRLLSVLTFILLSSAWLTTAAGQQPNRVLYVDNRDSTCNGRSPCFTTIQAAIDAAQARDTIQIQAGVYREQLTIDKNNFLGVTESDRIFIESG